VDKDRGIDGNKKIKGRKEHIVTDVLGLPLAMVIQAANVFDGVGARDVFKNLANKYPRLRRILADGGYRGEELAEEAKRYGWEFPGWRTADGSLWTSNSFPSPPSPCCNRRSSCCSLEYYSNEF
jgi:hypothetical protein